MSFATDLYNKIDLKQYSPGDRIQICPATGQQHKVNGPKDIKARSNYGCAFQTVSLNAGFYQALGLEVPTQLVEEVEEEAAEEEVEKPKKKRGKKKKDAE